jgi:peptidoglycan/LPS O-acetylase OafA/YrhL
MLTLSLSNPHTLKIMQPQAKLKSQLVQLDVIRGIAILAVFLFHTYGATFGLDHLPFLGNFRDYSKAPSLAFLVFWPYQYGDLGVVLFFVLSGFCIHLSFLKYVSSLEKQGLSFSFKTYMKDFFVRRLFRIYPAYLLALLFFSFAYPTTRVDIGTFDGSFQFFSHLFLVHNFSTQSFFGINPAFWSIAVEVQLYCIYPLFLILRDKLKITKATLAVFVLQLSYSQLNWDLDRQINEIGKNLHVPLLGSSQIFTQLPLTFWPTWIVGACLAEKIFFENKKMLNLNLRYKLFLSLLYLISTQYKTFYIIGYYAIILLFVSLIEDYIFDRPHLNILENIVVKIGLCSYSIYLFHQPLLGWFAAFPFAAFPSKLLNPYFICTLGAILIFIPVFVISWLSYQYLEIPTHNAGKKIAQKLSLSELKT